MKSEMRAIAARPIFFERNRVFRVYLGGKLFYDFFGDEPKDGNLPEEWVASAVHAINRDSTDPKEGVSKVRGTDIYLDELIEECGKEILGDRKKFGMLVKILDSAVRLPMQAHPDKPYSNRYFGSDYGKAEMWIILATRENAKIYFGFKDKITKEEFAEAVEKSETDKDIMQTLANEIEVKPGDVFFVPAKMVHAIGSGCFIMEIQEPTDFTIQPEYWCDEYHLNEKEMYLGLTKEQALDCFDYSLYGGEAAALARKTPKVIKETDELITERLVGPEDTPCFSVNRYRLKSGNCPLTNSLAVYMITDGCGTLTDGNTVIPLHKGEYFLLPAAAENWRMETKDGMEWVECLPPKK